MYLGVYEAKFNNNIIIIFARKVKVQVVKLQVT